MIRSLWTASTGMTAQQLNVDTIANNLANVNTVGYKKESLNFKSLLYANLDVNALPGETNLPEPLQVGHGVRTASVSRYYSTGVLQSTESPTDMAIDGKGFFSIQHGDETLYTKDGSFRIALTDDATYALVTASGDPVLSVEGESILIDTGIATDDLMVSQDGFIYYLDTETNARIDIAQLGIVQFANTEGLEATGTNLYRQTASSGNPLLEAENEDLKQSSVTSRFLEASNVQTAEEMVKLIIAQRAYEMNSTVIKTSDSMLQQANELKR